MSILESPAKVKGGVSVGKTLFISDLHLDSSQPHITNTFFYFLDHIAHDADALYILGDFFESYIGDDNNDFVKLISRALFRLTHVGVPIFLMHGNHDFLMGKSFENNTSVVLIPDPSIINLYNQKILLTHGDSLCTDDKSHQRFRKLSRNTIIQKIFLSLPISLRQKIAKQLRNESKQHNQMKSAEMMNTNQNAILHAIKKNNVVKLIHGHTHKPEVTAEKIVLDAWHHHGNYVQISGDGKVELVNIPY